MLIMNIVESRPDCVQDGVLELGRKVIKLKNCKAATKRASYSFLDSQDLDLTTFIEKNKIGGLILLDLKMYKATLSWCVNGFMIDT